MKEKNLYDSWLDHSLSEEERESLQNDEQFLVFEKITQAAQYFRSPELDVSSSYDRLLSDLESKNKITSWRTYAASIAAILMIGFLTYTTVFSEQPSNYSSQIGEKLAIELPLKSRVQLNAGASLSYDKTIWKKSREVTLQGEAFFDVTPGASFKVTTTDAIIVVTGTKFNVAQHEDYLTVACYEGSIAVQIGNMSYSLEKGQQITLINSKLEHENVAIPNPSWINNKSYFKSTPLTFILDELARQYELDLETDSVDKSVIFTGSFTHENLDTALQSISIPLKLSYTIEGTKVRLVKEN